MLRDRRFCFILRRSRFFGNLHFAAGEFFGNLNCASGEKFENGRCAAGEFLKLTLRRMIFFLKIDIIALKGNFLIGIAQNVTFWKFI